jgi:uncharacterized membrane protein YczE
MMAEQKNKGQMVWRGLIYCVGMLALALGITLNTKTGLGVSPIISVAYSVSEIWHLNFGDMTFLLYALFVAAQFALRGRNSRWYDLLQLVVSLVFSRFLNLFSACITYDSGNHSFVVNLLLLALAIALTGVGVSMTVNMRLIPNPGDGIVQAVAERAGWEQGFAKNVFDLGCVAATILIGLLFAHRVIGISIGTVLAMIGVGRVVALTNYLFKGNMCRAAGLG